MTNKKHILIIGSGSVGQRHAKNLKDLNCNVSIVDPRKDRLDDSIKLFKVENSYLNIDQALNNTKYDGSIICSPTKYHLAQATVLLEKKIPTLMEKPISIDYNSAIQFKQFLKKNTCEDLFMLGYTWRWWKALIKMRELINNSIIGKEYHAQYFMSAHLADWHPWEPYQDFFMASKELGGGALLDESHWIDQMLWFFGLPDSISATVDKISDLEITSDDSVELIASYKNGLKVFIHLDIYGRPHEKSIKILGKEGKIEWSDEDNSVNIFSGLEKKESFNFKNDRNNMFIDLLKDFIDLIDKKSSPICNIDDGLKVMTLIDAVRESHKSGKTIKIEKPY